MQLAVDMLTDLGFRGPYRAGCSCLCDRDGDLVAIISPAIPGRPVRDDIAEALAELLNAQALAQVTDRRAA